MPFRSKAQARKLFATNPAVAREFASVTPSIQALPERVGKDSTHQAVAKRLRRKGLAQGKKQRAEVESRHPFRNEPAGGPIKAQPGSRGK